MRKQGVTVGHNSTEWSLLRIELLDIQPLVWRRVLVPENITLTRLHHVTQAAMGWLGVHLHSFHIQGVDYGVLDPEFDMDSGMRSQHRVSLKKALAGAKSLVYTYDFGDCWEHRIQIEEQLPAACAMPQPLWCTGGANACPPEDVGGVPGYARFCEALSNPAHPEHAELLEWFGGAFDPNHFNVDEANMRLSKIR